MNVFPNPLIPIKAIITLIATHGPTLNCPYIKCLSCVPPVIIVDSMMMTVPERMPLKADSVLHLGVKM